MATVSVDQARPGMVLLLPVTDRRGRLLIPAGNALTERHVHALKMWGVTQLDIEGDESEHEEAGDISPEILEAAEAFVDGRFGDNDPAHPFLATLRDCAIKRKAAQLAAGDRSC